MGVAPEKIWLSRYS
ncbi:hypothetical protein LED19_10165 [Salmonella enterica]|nr:hypothetical protein [Salmonella enterica]